MSGLKFTADKAPAGVEVRERDGRNEIAVPDLRLVEELIHARAEASENIYFRAGVSSRSRVRLELGVSPGEKEARVQFILEPGACVDVFCIAEGKPGRGTVPVELCYHLKKHASLNVWTYVGSGGGPSRIGQTVIFEEEHAFASLRGLSIIDGDSEIHHKIEADHRTGNCISRQFYKSILAGQSRSGFESLVSVAKGAARSDSKQLNKNLILSAKAKASSRPELRIHTDDVSCTHGSATGELSQEELFYLRSRGLAESDARFMMIHGFADEILEDVSYAPLKKQLSEFVRGRIAGMVRA